MYSSTFTGMHYGNTFVTIGLANIRRGSGKRMTGHEKSKQLKAICQTAPNATQRVFAEKNLKNSSQLAAQGPKQTFIT